MGGGMFLAGFKAGPREEMHARGEGSEETGVKTISTFATESFPPIE